MPKSLPWWRPFYWSVRRELWDHRSIYLAPLATAAFFIVFWVIGRANPSHFHVQVDGNSPVLAHEGYYLATLVILLVTVITGLLYSLASIYEERKDRSLLFWKSLPVSDAATIAAKASLPLVVLPAAALVAITSSQASIFLLTKTLLPSSGFIAAPPWSPNGLFPGLLTMPYFVAILSLYFTPLCAAALVISAMARRAPGLWAVAVLLGIGAVEKLSWDFGGSWLHDFIDDRLKGGVVEAFAQNALGGPDFSRPDLARFLSAPNLWIGFTLAAALFASAIWLRRRGEPI